MKRSIITIAVLGLSGLLGQVYAQTWVNPYTPGSTADNIIRFKNGADGTIVAPDPAPAVVISYSSALNTGTGGGWNLGTSGSAAIGLVVTLGQTNATTGVTNQNLNFGINSSGLSNLVGVSLPMTWSASSTITGSDTWVSDTGNYRYNFSLQLSNALVNGGNLDLFGGINLTIKAGSTTLYNVTGLNQILGITSITGSTYDDANVAFSYNPADGPLQITWSAGSTVNLSLLNILGGGNNTFYNVHSTSITTEAIPEVSSLVLLMSGSGLLALFRRRTAAKV